MSANQIALKIKEVESNLSSILADHDNLRSLTKQAATPEEGAKIALGLAFTLNSLFYSMVRAQGSRGQTVL